MHLGAEDVVRNRLVGDIVTAYAEFDAQVPSNTRSARFGSGDR
jgi:phosphate starvation-inducible PhoH-like protein